MCPLKGHDGVPAQQNRGLREVDNTSLTTSHVYAEGENHGNFRGKQQQTSLFVTGPHQVSVGRPGSEIVIFCLRAMGEGEIKHS